MLLGLDLGTHSIKAVQTRKQGSRYEVVQYAEVPTPPEAIQGGVIDPGQALVEPLKALVQQLKGAPRDAAVAIPAQMALVRRLAMPKLPVKRLRALIESQGQQFIPFYRDGAAFDMVVTNPALNDREQEILLVAVPTALLERLRTTLKAAGLRLVAVDVEVLALYRAALARGVVQPQAPVALVEAGHSRARVAIFNGGWPSLVRSLDVLPLFGDEEPNPDARYVTPDEFATEVRRTTEVLMTQSKTEGISGLVLSARWPAEEMAPLLADEIIAEGRPVEGFEVVTVGEGIPPGFGVAYGLALALAAEPRNLHLLPRVPLDIQRQRRTAGLILLLTLLLAGGYGWYWYQEDLRQQAERQRLQEQIAEHNEYLTRESEVAALEARRRALDALIKEYESWEPWTVVYPHLRSLLPPDVRLLSINMQRENLTLSGTAGTPESLAELVQRLQDSPLIKPPILHSYDTGGGSFNISAKLSLRGGAK